MNKPILIAVLACIGGNAWSAPTTEPLAPADPATVPAPGAATQKVIVSGSRLSDTEERRQSTAGKLIFGREELDRNGDTTLGEVLKRLPGVTLGGRPGRGGDVRLRGLGSGYTQILLNGERAPRGFAIDSLSPEQVERVEIIRGPVAEYSTQAIAGTINIVLREGYQQKETQLRVSDGVEQGRHAPNLSITYPGKSGAFTYLLTGTIFENRQRDDTLTDNLGLDPQGQPNLVQQVADDSVRRSRGLHLSPRLNYRFENGDTLTFQPFLVLSHSETAGQSLLTQSIGPAAPYASANYTAQADSSTLRGFGNWQRKLDAGAKLNVKFGFGDSHSDSTTVRGQFGTDGALRDQLRDTNTVRDNSANLGGKYTAPLGNGHLLALGADGEWGQRTQNRSSLDNGRAEFPDSGEDLSAKTRRLDAFVQDDWDINAQWATNLGLRWEGIRTASDVGVGNSLTNTSSVWSPVAHFVWHLPGATKDQVRLGITHSYRAPSLNDLIALPSLSRLNSPTSPDRIGNPALQPELATGIDIAFEHYLSRSGILSANLFRRNIRDLMRRETTLQDNGSGPRWVSAPVNIGHANTTGLELEAKFQLAEFMDNAPALDLRANYSRFWSRVEDIPGPNNRLDSQAKQTANLGLDYRLAKSPLTLGGGVNWTPGYLIQTTLTQSNVADNKRQLDVYALWKFSAATQLRFSANNLFAKDYGTGSTLNNSAISGGVNQQASVNAKTYTTWSVKLEFKI
jgi:iron complex outermembrane receptor protein